MTNFPTLFREYTGPWKLIVIVPLRVLAVREHWEIHAKPYLDLEQFVPERL